MWQVYGRQLLAVIFALTFTLTACEEIKNALPNGGGSTFNGDNPGGDGDPDDGSGGGNDGGTIPGDGGGPGGDGGVIQTFRPALAVRATGCIMCHGRVEANIITDFGYGDPFFFGQLPSHLPPHSGNIYGNHAENWQTAKVWGKIFVPEASFQGATLANYLRARVGAPDATTPAPIVEEKAQIYIGAPTEARLLQIAGAFPPAHPRWKYMVQQVGADVTGLELASGGQFVQNTQGTELVCNGDLVINSTLFLNNVQIRTENKGCRIYVTKSVFIQGPITFLGSFPDRNLQISSARAIVMGLGPGATDGGAANTLSNRLQDFWTRGSYQTRDTSLSTQEKLDLIAEEGANIAELKDASAQLPNRRAVGFERVFFNAPNYQSRYQGQFRGVILAELALASLGAFSFHFDSVFERVPILPLLQPNEYLRVQ